MSFIAAFYQQGGAFSRSVVDQAGEFFWCVHFLVIHRDDHVTRLDASAGGRT
jgi:hypothetical protein